MIGRTHARGVCSPLLTVTICVLALCTRICNGDEYTAVTSAATGVTEYLPASSLGMETRPIVADSNLVTQDSSAQIQRYSLPLQHTAAVATEVIQQQQQQQVHPDYASQRPAVVRSAAQQPGQEVITELQQESDEYNNEYDDDEDYDDTAAQGGGAATAGGVNATATMTASSSSSSSMGQATAATAAAAESKATRTNASPSPVSAAAAATVIPSVQVDSSRPLPSVASTALVKPATTPAAAAPTTATVGKASSTLSAAAAVAAAAAAQSRQGAVAVNASSAPTILPSPAAATPAAAAAPSPRAATPAAIPPPPPAAAAPSPAAAVRPVAPSPAVTISAPTSASNPTTPPKSPSIPPADAAGSSSSSSVAESSSAATQQDPAVGDYSDYSPADAIGLQDDQIQAPVAPPATSSSNGGGGSSSSTAAKTPIRVLTPTTMPPIIPAPPMDGAASTPASATAAAEQSGGSTTVREGAQALNRISDQSNTVRSAGQLSTTIVTVRAPTDTPVTVKVRPGGPDTAVDVLVDGESDNILDVENNGGSNAPVTVQVQPQPSNSNAAKHTNMDVLDDNQTSNEAKSDTSSGSTGLQPVFRTGIPTGGFVTNTSSSSIITTPGTLATHSPGKNYTDIPPWVFTQPGASNNVTLGCILPFEGSQALIGAASLTAMKMAVTELAPRLLPATNVTLLCENTLCVDVAAHHAMLKLADTNAVAVLGEICSGASVAAAGVAADKQLPLISPASTSTTLSAKEFFMRTVPSDRYQGAALANLMHGNGVKAVGLVYEDSTYGYGLAFNFIAAFTNLNGTVPSVYKFARGTSGDPKAAVSQMLAARNNRTQAIDAVFVTTNNLDFVAGFLKEAYAARLNLPIYGGDSLADQTLGDNVKGSPSDISRVIATVPHPGSEAFQQSFIRFSGGWQQYDAFAAQAYDAMRVVLSALAATNDTSNGRTLRNEMVKQRFQGVSGPIEFDQQGDLKPGLNSYAWIVFDSTTGRPVPRGFIDARRRSLLRLRLQ